MQSTMMHFPLTLTHILERAGSLFGESEVVSRLPDGTLHRYRYRDFHRRAESLGGALQKLGLARGERVATLMWNHYVHLEAYFAVPCAGGVLHTLNLRLHPDDIAYIVNHACDRYLIIDDVLLPLYEKIRSRTRFDRVIVVPLSGESVSREFLDYEHLVGQSMMLAAPEFGENDPAAMCYTTGTTGKPKGVVYSHRSIALHSLAIATTDYFGVSNRDTVCPVVPMFHVNAWGIPYTAAMMGAKLVLPGPHLDAESLLDLFEVEGVTLTAGVPTIWAGIQQALEKEPGRWRLAPGMRMAVGGAPATETMIRAFDRFGLRILHGWGMTETSPVGTFNFMKRELADLSAEQQYELRGKQGVPLPFFEVRAMADQGEAPRDGKTMGELQVRGPWVAAAYHDHDAVSANWTEDGWFRTGDIAAVDSAGYVRITDRLKDLVKSGGEWISSLALESALAGHPKVAEAAVIGLPHPKWDERPLAVVVLKPDQSASSEELRSFLAPRFASFWLPDAFVFVQSIPRTSTGKMMKSRLREQFRDWRWE